MTWRKDVIWRFFLMMFKTVVPSPLSPLFIRFNKYTVYWVVSTLETWLNNNADPNTIVVLISPRVTVEILKHPVNKTHRKWGWLHLTKTLVLGFWWTGYCLNVVQHVDGVGRLSRGKGVRVSESFCENTSFIVYFFVNNWLTFYSSGTDSEVYQFCQ
jgi:hypothetical protein